MWNAEDEDITIFCVKQICYSKGAGWFFKKKIFAYSEFGSLVYVTYFQKYLRILFFLVSENIEK